jgi:hypothetical protein
MRATTYQLPRPHPTQARAPLLMATCSALFFLSCALVQGPRKFRTCRVSQPASITNLKGFQGGCAPPHLSRHFNIPCRRRLCHKASNVQRRCAVCAQRHAPQPQDPRQLQAQLCSAMQLMNRLRYSAPQPQHARPLQVQFAHICYVLVAIFHFVLHAQRRHAIRTECNAPYLRYPRALQAQLRSATQFV